MELEFTPTQLAMLANGLEMRFKENPSLFKAMDPPKHTIQVQLAPHIQIAFSGGVLDSQRVMITYVGSPGPEYVAHRPFILFHPIRYFIYRYARKKLWRLAEALFPKTDRAERLLYELFPEMLEKDMKK